MATLQTQPLPLYQKQGRVWVQRTELAAYILRENHGMTGINFPEAAPTAIRAQSSRIRTGSQVVDVTQGDTDLPQFAVPTRLATTKNLLLAIGGGEKVNVQLHTGPSGNPTQYDAAHYGLGWVAAMRGTGTVDAGAILDNAGEGVPLGLEIPFVAVLGPILIDWRVSLTKPASGTTLAVKALHVLPPLKDDSPSRRILPGEVGAHVEAFDTGVTPAKVFIWKDGLRTTPTATAADPFANTVDITDIIGYGDKRDNRFIVSAGTQAAQVPQVALTDDEGATWSLKSLGATNAEFARRLWIVDASHIYAFGGGAAASKIWESGDGGNTWTEYNPSLAKPLVDGKVMGNGFGIAVGEANVLARCYNFNDWAAITGPSGGAGDNILAVGIKPTSGTVFIGNAAGELYASQDEGDTWQTVTSRIQGYTATSINHIMFDETGEYGFMEISTAAARVILRTTDGGNSWRIYNLGNAGLANVAKNKIWVFGPNDVLAGGAVSGGSGSLVRAQSNFDGSLLF